MSELPVRAPNTQELANKTAKQQALDAIATGKINLAGTYQNDFAFIGLDDVGVDSVGNPLVLVDGNVETVVLATPGSGVPAGVAPLASPVFTGLVTTPSTSTAGGATASTPTPTTGSAFTPSSASDSELSFAVASTASFTVTYGPSTGAEHTILSSTALPVGAFFNKRIPKGWKVVITGTIADLENILVVTC